MAEQAKGVCPECGRTVPGRAVGPEKLAADRKWVVLAPHTRSTTHRRNPPCLTPGGYRKVPRVPGSPAVTMAGGGGRTTTCRHCAQAIERCPHVPAAFCRGWKHAGLEATLGVVLAHFCAGQSNGPLAEPGEMSGTGTKTAGSGDLSRK